MNVLTAPGRALEAALQTARKLATGPSGAMGVIKSEIAAAPHNDLATQLVLEARGINTARFGAEAAEGLSAFLDKRRPDFAGKAGDAS